MGKRKLTALAAALVAVDALSPEETTTLLDYLRGKQPKTPRKKTEKKKTGPTPIDNLDREIKSGIAS